MEKKGKGWITCKCGNQYEIHDNYWWDESGYGYSTKLSKCPACGKIIVVEYIEDRCLDVNNDKRYYKY